MATMFYKLRTGEIVDLDDVKKAFRITHGKRVDVDDPKYLRFLHSCLGKSIVQAVNADKDEYLKDGVISGIKKYREDKQCTLSEANTFVRDHLRQLFDEVK